MLSMVVGEGGPKIRSLGCKMQLIQVGNYSSAACSTADGGSWRYEAINNAKEKKAYKTFARRVYWLS